MKKYLLGALVFLLSPLVASAITPKPGHYEGQVRFFEDGDMRNRHISFNYVDTIHGGLLYNLHTFPNVFEKGFFSYMPVGSHSFTFNTADIVNIQFSGHGKWSTNTFCAGDIREHAANTPFWIENIYYLWKAHWVHDN